MKNFFISSLVAVVLLVAYWLISPLWRNVRLDEPLPQATNLNVPASTIKDNLEAMDTATKEQFQKETEAMKDKQVAMAEEMPIGEPRILGEAMLFPRAHEVEGTVKLISLGENSVIRFEDFKTINGPDLRVYLSADLGADDFVDLGPIRATEGNVNYAVPAGTDTNTYRNVLIWCRAFRVLFSYAQL